MACYVHLHRALVPQERHHVHPLGYGGPDTKANVVVVCANGHGNVHYLLEALLKAGGRPAHDVLASYTRLVRELAWLGYDAVMADGAERAAEIEGAGR